MSTNPNTNATHHILIKGLTASKVQGALQDADVGVKLLHAADNILPILSAVSPKLVPFAELVGLADKVAPTILSTIENAIRGHHSVNHPLDNERDQGN